VRELMMGAHSFNDIHRGVPLISRAVLVARLRELEDHGVIERRPRADGVGLEYFLTTAGEALRPIVTALGQWGLNYTQDRIKRSDLDPALSDLGFAQARRSERTARPSHRPALRILRRAGKPHEIPDHVADPRKIGCRRLHEGSGICRRSHAPRQYP